MPKPRSEHPTPVWVEARQEQANELRAAMSHLTPSERQKIVTGGVTALKATVDGYIRQHPNSTFENFFGLKDASAESLRKNSNYYEVGELVVQEGATTVSVKLFVTQKVEDTLYYAI